MVALVQHIARSCRIPTDASPSLRGYSRRNIYNMVALYESYSTMSFLKIAERFRLESQQNEIMQSTTAQIGDAEIVQFQTA